MPHELLKLAQGVGKKQFVGVRAMLLDFLYVNRKPADESRELVYCECMPATVRNKLDAGDVGNILEQYLN